MDTQKDSIAANQQRVIAENQQRVKEQREQRRVWAEKQAAWLALQAKDTNLGKDPAYERSHDYHVYYQRMYTQDPTPTIEVTDDYGFEESSISLTATQALKLLAWLKTEETALTEQAKGEEAKQQGM